MNNPDADCIEYISLLEKYWRKSFADILAENDRVCMCGSCYKVPPLSFAIRYPTLYCWTCAIAAYELPEDLLKNVIAYFEADYFDSSIMFKLCKYQNVPEEFLEKYSNRLSSHCWRALLENPRIELTEAFYEKYKDKFE